MLTECRELGCTVHGETGFVRSSPPQLAEHLELDAVADVHQIMDVRPPPDPSAPPQAGSSLPLQSAHWPPPRTPSPTPPPLPSLPPATRVLTPTPSAHSRHDTDRWLAPGDCSASPSYEPRSVLTR